MNGNYEESVRLFTERNRKFPVGRPLGRVMLAASYTLLGKGDEAAAEARAIREAFPDFNLSQWSYIHTWKSEENRRRLYNAAKAAGVPEYPAVRQDDGD